MSSLNNEELLKVIVKPMVETFGRTNYMKLGIYIKNFRTKRQMKGGGMRGVFFKDYKEGGKKMKK